MAKTHQVQPGDTTVSLSEEHGLFADTIWQDPANAELRENRKDMNILQPGDEIVIPDKRVKQEDCVTDKRHVFRRKGIPAKFRLQVLDGGKIVAGAPYRLVVDDELVLEGSTDGSGFFEHFLPANSKKGLLAVRPAGERPIAARIDFGHLDPVNSITGLEKRLQNLGYIRRIPDESAASRIWNGVRRLQRDHGLAVTGKVDAETQALLEQLHETGKEIPGAGGKG